VSFNPSKQIGLAADLKGEPIVFGNSTFPDLGVAFYLFHPQGRMMGVLDKEPELFFGLTFDRFRQQMMVSFFNMKKNPLLAPPPPMGWEGEAIIRGNR